MSSSVRGAMVVQLCHGEERVECSSVDIDADVDDDDDEDKDDDDDGDEDEACRAHGRAASLPRGHGTSRVPS